LRDVLGRSAAQTRFLTALLSVFAVHGLALGAIGGYGVTAFTVARWTSALGVRMALGATRRDVVWTAARGGVIPITAGAIAGVGLGLLGGQWLRSSLFEIQPNDPLTLVGVIVVLALASVLALCVPAWRAGRVDPATVLSVE
jgi:ABC-type antimicrobial peptide transport system permease subunit